MSATANHTHEQRAAYLYAACARAEAGTVRAELFARLAGEAQAQAAIWRARITSRGLPPPPPFVPDLRTRLVARLVGVLGPRRLRTVLAAMKVRGMAIYTVPAGQLPARGVPVLPEADAPEPRVGVNAGHLRATVRGVNDGLVSNASLILGVAGAGTDAKLVLVSGIAGLAAGAFAVAAGEYASVRAQRELLDHQVDHRREELAHSPESEVQELALIYAAKGLPQREAARLAKRIVADPERALDAFAREELDLDPHDLGSPTRVALGALAAFAAGAALPLVPLLFAPAAWALPAAIGVAAIGCMAVGACLSLFTGRSAAQTAGRMLAIGIVAGSLSFGLGRVVGALIG
ncbi:MAG: VIT1/CCC1 transporter family protein [Burkholderiales bacterium]|nr:VIT1/CCC1 transporter family protein [Burkholderiales bacterium]